MPRGIAGPLVGIKQTLVIITFLREGDGFLKMVFRILILPINKKEMTKQSLNLRLNEKVLLRLRRMQSFLNHRIGLVFTTSSKIGTRQHHPTLRHFVRRVIVFERILQGLLGKRHSLLHFFLSTLSLHAFRLRKIDIGEVMQIGRHILIVTVINQLAHQIDTL